VPAVELKGVTKRFGSTVALDHVDLTVADGSFAVLVGPSGSGKSTLLQLVASLERPDEGTITVAGHQLGRHERELCNHRRNDIGLVFQLHNLIPRLTARQNIELAMFGTHRRARERKARAQHILEIVGLEHKADDKPPTMSGGERQRVAVGRALANEPKLLLADEPTGSLDDDSADQVLMAFERLRTESAVTVLAVSHDARLNARADHTITVTHGRIGPTPT
jgi:putative ABC transport system ATP-binding protein